MQQRYFFLIICLMLALTGWAQVPQTISGTVQTEAGMPLPGATIFFKGTYNGGSTNEEGQFQIKADFSKGPQVLSISFVGYETQMLTLAQPDNALVVTLRPSAVLDQVVVAASRVEESIGQVPVTVEKLSQRQVEQITTPDLVAGLGRFKGIDVSSSSLLTTSFSTRGFNSSRSERVIQLSDYMDTQVPSLSSYFGNLLGAPVLDVASVEIVHGPASALYGANAFNGVLLTNSKDPFKEPGLTVRLRGGNRDLLDGQLRYATKIGERVAFKISGGATVANDFIADNKDATSALIEPANNQPGSAAGYDAVSRYGDVNTGYVFANVLVNPATRQPYTNAQGQPIPTPAELRGKTLFLPGFSESELVAGDNKTHSYKVAPSLSVLLTNSIKATADYKYTYVPECQPLPFRKWWGASGPGAAGRPQLVCARLHNARFLGRHRGAGRWFLQPRLPGGLPAKSGGARRYHHHLRPALRGHLPGRPGGGLARCKCCFRGSRYLAAARHPAI
jgi:iron complex outermembrane receptor protein